MKTYDEQLTEALRTRAADVPGDVLSLDDVKRTAHRLRWQRRAVVGAAAAVVIAIAVPVGLSVSSGLDGREPDPAPSPPEPKHVVLTTDVVEKSGEPAIPYLYDSAINLPTGSLVEVSGSYDGLARLGDGWVLTGQSGSGDRVVAFTDVSGQVTETVPGGGEVALSADGSLVAFTAGNQVKVRSTSGETWTLPGTTEGDGYPVGVWGGDGRCDGTEASPEFLCTVYLNDDGGAKLTGVGAGFVEFPYLRMADLSVDRTTAGLVSSTDTGSCSEVNYGDGQEIWGTCDYSLGGFSPDGGLVIGRPAYLDGAGDSMVAILDSTTGDLLAEFKSSPERPAMINNAVWENNRTLLATVYQDGAWTLMRMTADGELTRVSDLVGGEDFAPPLFLPATP